MNAVLTCDSRNEKSQQESAVREIRMLRLTRGAKVHLAPTLLVKLEG